VLVGLSWSKEALDARIDARVDRMFASGFVDEARALLARPGGVGREAEQALGYRELFGWLREGADAGRLPELIAKVKRDTRRFAKRQLTFFRHMRDIDWIEVAETTEPAAIASAIVDRFNLKR
jgi:tRNA dimethylallyltransferase